MKAVDIEIAVARHFDYRQNIIIPNVSWGFFYRSMEVDMLIVRPSGWAVEVEIKISTADIKRDRTKPRYRFTNLSPYYSGLNLIQRRYFAVPNGLDACAYIPETAGIFAVNDDGGVITVRPAAINKLARKLTEAEINKVLRLGCMRIWTLKEALSKAKASHLSQAKEGR